MSDISKCYGAGCGKADSCYRFTATANEYWQSWFCESPLQPDGSCDHYWDNGLRKIKKPKPIRLTAQQEYSATMSKDNNA